MGLLDKAKQAKGDEKKDVSKPSKSYYKVIDGEKYDRELLEKAEEISTIQDNGKINIEGANKLWKYALDNDKVTKIEIKTLEYIYNNMDCTDKAKNFLKKQILKNDKIKIKETEKKDEIEEKDIVEIEGEEDEVEFDEDVDEDVEIAEEEGDEKEDIESDEDFQRRIKTMSKKERKKAEKDRKKLLKEIEREKKRKKSGKPLSKKEKEKIRKREEENKLEKKKELKHQLKETHKRKLEELKERRLKAKDKALEKEIEDLERKAELGELEIEKAKSEVLPDGVELAGWDKRFLAWFIDMIIIIILPLIIIVSNADNAILGMVILIFLPFIYWFALESASGQSIGKKIMGTRITDMSGRRIDNNKTGKQAFGKGFYLIPIFPLVPIIDFVFGLIKSRDLKQRYTQQLSDIIVVINSETVKELAKEGIPEYHVEKGEKPEEEEIDERELLINTLISINGVSKTIAENIYDSGFTTLDSIKEAKLIDFKGIKGVGKATATRIMEGIKDK